MLLSLTYLQISSVLLWTFFDLLKSVQDLIVEFSVLISSNDLASSSCDILLAESRINVKYLLSVICLLSYMSAIPCISRSIVSYSFPPLVMSLSLSFSSTCQACVRIISLVYWLYITFILSFRLLPCVSA